MRRGEDIVDFKVFIDFYSAKFFLERGFAYGSIEYENLKDFSGKYLKDKKKLLVYIRGVENEEVCGFLSKNIWLTKKLLVFCHKTYEK